MILVAGIGNIFLGDDAFGSEVARCMLQRRLPGDVVVKDFGIRTVDLLYSLMKNYDRVIIVDAAPRGGEPGSIYLIEPDEKALTRREAPGEDLSLDPHSMNPMRVLALARSMGAEIKNVRIVGCEPETPLLSDSDTIGLSPRVSGAIPKAIELIESLVQEAGA
jgi:hydrogenase maturation protease